MDLEELLEQVDSKASFLAFVSALGADWESSQVAEREKPSSPHGPDAGGWENPGLGGFLEAMQAWTTDMGDRVPSTPSWKTFATMLLAAKYYE